MDDLELYSLYMLNFVSENILAMNAIIRRLIQIAIVLVKRLIRTTCYCKLNKGGNHVIVEKATSTPSQVCFALVNPLLLVLFLMPLTFQPLRTNSLNKKTNILVVFLFKNAFHFRVPVHNMQVMTSYVDELY